LILIGKEQTKLKKKKLKYKIITIFILPPSKDELLKRLLNREQKDKKTVNERMEQFNEDLVHWKNYDFVVINDNLENCYDQIRKYINNKKNNSEFIGYDKKLIEKHIENLLD